MMFFLKPRFKLQAAFMMGLIFWSTGCQTDNFHGSKMPENVTTTDFTLIDQNGQPFTLSEQKGNVVLMFFGYTFCPDVCPATLSNFMEVKKALGEQANKVKFVYITVDPERDTPQRLKDHLSNFDAEFIGLTGDKEKLDQVYTAYGVYHDKNYVEGSDGLYFMSHTSNIYVIDQDGKWRLLFHYGTAPEDMVHDIQMLLD